jgi:hypothetical protein
MTRRSCARRPPSEHGGAIRAISWSKGNARCSTRSRANGGRRADRQSLLDALARRDVRDEAAAVRGESRQVRRRATELRGETNAILDTVAMMVTDVLRRGGFELLAPVVARFRTTDTGNTGVEVAVRLEEPSQANAAKAAISERFPDHLSQVIVT